MEHMKLALLMTLFVLLIIPPVTHAQTDEPSCENAFDDARNYTAAVFEQTTARIDDGNIPWKPTDWDNIIRRVVGGGEFFLNTCAIVNQPLSEQTELVDQLASLSLISAPVDTVDVGGDFGEVALTTTFTPTTQLIDLDGDGEDELILHTQIPYFSEDTVYQIRGGLSIAYFKTDDGWQGHIIAPVSSFVTDNSGGEVLYSQSDSNTLSVESGPEALVYFPAPVVEVRTIDDTPLTFITLASASGTGLLKELDVLTWEDQMPRVKLRVAFDEWCYPGEDLQWEVREDGSVFVPSNGGDANSDLHCGQTPETLFQWQDGEYIPES
jgi:hypothetical protein